MTDSTLAYVAVFLFLGCEKVQANIRRKFSLCRFRIRGAELSHSVQQLSKANWKLFVTCEKVSSNKKGLLLVP